MIAALLAVWFAMSASGKSVDLPVVASVDLPRYMGTWYEISHIPNSAQAGCRDTTVHYRLNDSGAFDVVNACWKDGRYKPYNGTASRVDPASNAKYRVKFFVFFGADYWITDLDPAYRWAVVGAPSRERLWIISRDPKLEESVYRGILERARLLGFDTNKLELTIQSGKAPHSDRATTAG